jgi:DNA polymerase III gamma/tau subunit
MYTKRVEKFFTFFPLPMTISLSLANKYRPQTFADGMIGQHAIREILEAKMQSNSGSLQNYLLT